MSHRWNRLARSLASLSLPLLSILGSATAAFAAETAPHSGAVPQITQRVDSSSYVTLKGNTYPLGAKALDRGVLPPATPAQRLLLVLKRPAEQEAALEQFLSDAHTPGSPNFHKWLTPAQFGAQFGPADSDVQAVVAWLQSQGFAVAGVSGGKTAIEFSGTTGQIQSAFRAAIHQYSVAGVVHMANASDPQIPAALAPVVAGISSLNDFRARPLSHVLGQATYNLKTHTAVPQWTYPEMGGTTFPLAPEDFSVQYNTKPLLNSGITGQGQTIGIVNNSNINLDLVAAFRSLFQLPASAPQIVLDGNDPGINGDAVEAYLDVEWAGATAPGAAIKLYVGGGTALQDGITLASLRAVDENSVPIISVSFGLCEAFLGSSGNALISSIWQQAAAQGQTVLVASGDSGSAGCDDPNTVTVAKDGLQVSGYASTPYNVAVGGTDFYYSSWNSGNAQTIANQVDGFWAQNNDPSLGSLQSRIPEQPWDDSQFGDNVGGYNPKFPTITGSGGGVSNCATSTQDAAGNITCTGGVPQPAWQVGAGVPIGGGRAIPDISLFAADGLNYSYYPICAQALDCTVQTAQNAPQISGVGGTSAATPAMAGVMALIVQKYGRQGQANYVLYPLAAQHSSVFHDVTVGSNNEPCTQGSNNCSQDTNGDGFFSLQNYAATTGYDLATGLGSVDANALVTNWNSITFQGSTTTLAISPTSFPHGTKVSLTSNVSSTTGAAVQDGSVAFLTNNSNPVNIGQGAASVVNGTVTATTTGLPGGTYQLYARYSGGGTYGPSQSAPQTLTVTPENSTLTLNALTPDANGNPVSITTALPYGTLISADATILSATAPTNQVNGIATGTVVFQDGSAPAVTTNVNRNSQAEYLPSAPGYFAVGQHSITASYSGDPSFSASKAGPVAFTVAKANTTLTAAASTTGTGYTVVVVPGVPPTGATAPSGTITVTSNGQTVGTPVPVTATTDPKTGGSEGTATVTIPAGSVAVALTYSGDGNYNGSTGQVGASYTVAATTPALTIAAPGQSATTAVSITPLNGFTGVVALTCSVTGPAGAQNAPSCSLSPTSVTIGSGPASSALTVTTTAASGAVAHPLARNEGRWYLAGGATLACVFLFGLPAKRRRWQGMLGVFLLIAALGALGCGGGSSTPKPPKTPGTTAGSYTVNISAANGANTSATSVTVTVQ